MGFWSQPSVSRSKSAFKQHIRLKVSLTILHTLNNFQRHAQVVKKVSKRKEWHGITERLNKPRIVGQVRRWRERRLQRQLNETKRSRLRQFGNDTNLYLLPESQRIESWAMPSFCLAIWNINRSSHAPYTRRFRTEWQESMQNERKRLRELFFKTLSTKAQKLAFSNLSSFPKALSWPP